MRYINASVNGRYVRVDNKNAGVQGEANETVLIIAFGGEWEGYGKRIVWRNARGENPVALTLNGNPCRTPIPMEPLRLAGWCNFTIEGLRGDSVALTAYERLEVTPRLGYVAPDEPTPPQALQLVERQEKDRLELPDNVRQTIFSDYGAIAKIAVSELRSDYEKPWRYLQRNTDDLFYMHLHGVEQDWIQANCVSGETEQWTNGDGTPIWWYHGEIGGDFTLVEQNSVPPDDPGGAPAPVIVWKYSERVKGKVSFEEVATSSGAVMYPMITLGQGDGTGRNIGKIYKDNHGLRLDFLASKDRVHSIAFDDDGITINGLKGVASAVPEKAEETVLQLKSITGLRVIDNLWSVLKVTKVV